MAMHNGQNPTKNKKQKKDLGQKSCAAANCVVKVFVVEYWETHCGDKNDKDQKKKMRVIESCAIRTWM